uniref:Ycf66 n=1 Tax=Sargassum thunbergii TaxID=127542 RepID=A0A109QSJ6_9PHAE|nr:Ycf66 [Sargassum thunbergii]AMB49067.1 Ycf66 [Sargassum thunbergii]
MINIVFGANFLLGLIIIIGVLLLYFLRIIRPELCRDEDIFFTTLGLIYGSILIIHGWRLDPILLFSQVLLVSVVLVAGWENIRLRGLIAKKIKEQLELPDYYLN